MLYGLERVTEIDIENVYVPVKLWFDRLESANRYWDTLTDQCDWSLTEFPSEIAREYGYSRFRLFATRILGLLKGVK